MYSWNRAMTMPRSGCGSSQICGDYGSSPSHGGKNRGRNVSLDINCRNERNHLSGLQWTDGGTSKKSLFPANEF